MRLLSPQETVAEAGALEVFCAFAMNPKPITKAIVRTDLIVIFIVL